MAALHQRKVTAQVAGGPVYELPPVQGSWLLHFSCTDGTANICVYSGRVRDTGRQITLHADKDTAVWVPGALPVVIKATGAYSATADIDIVAIPYGSGAPWPSPGYELGYVEATGGNISATVLDGIVQPASNRVTVVCLASSATSAVIEVEGRVNFDGSFNYVPFCEIDLATNVGYCTTPVPPGMFDLIRISSTGSSVNLYCTAWAYEDTGR